MCHTPTYLNFLYLCVTRYAYERYLSFSLNLLLALFLLLVLLPPLLLILDRRH